MVLQTDGLTKDYGDRRALDHLTIQVQRGEIFGLLGPNGSGKSTALRLLMGFLQPTEGRAAVAGHDCWQDSVAARRHVAYLPGELRLYENMSGRRLIDFLGQLRGKWHLQKAQALARQLDVDLERPIKDLSSGMKRKLALLQVLVADVPLLLLDEPTNTLDPTMREQLLDQLRRARDAGRAVLFSSHVLQEVERVADRVGILQRGRLVETEQVSRLQRGKSVWVRFESAAPVVPPLAGLQVEKRTDREIELEYIGPLDVLLQWLAGQAVADLRIEPLGLAPLYRRYHGSDA